MALAGAAQDDADDARHTTANPSASTSAARSSFTGRRSQRSSGGSDAVAYDSRCSETEGTASTRALDSESLVVAGCGHSRAMTSRREAIYVAAIAFPATADDTSRSQPNPSASTSASLSFTGTGQRDIRVQARRCSDVRCMHEPEELLGAPAWLAHVRREGGRPIRVEHRYERGGVVHVVAHRHVTTARVGDRSDGAVNLTNVTSASFTFTTPRACVVPLQSRRAAYAACTSPKSYSGLAAGSHTFRVKARDAAGNEAGPTTYTWTVDLDTTTDACHHVDAADLPRRRSPPSSSPTPSSPVTFECSIENEPFLACTSPFTFTVIVDTSNNGQHQFAVRAVDPAGNISGAASYKWKVDDVGFTITGNAGGLLYPDCGATCRSKSSTRTTSRSTSRAWPSR